MPLKGEIEGAVSLLKTEYSPFSTLEKGKGWGECIYSYCKVVTRSVIAVAGG